MKIPQALLDHARRSHLAALLLLLGHLLAPPDAQALPAYARQTGQSCVTCHAGGQFPELTPFGRTFKLTGYTIGQRAIPLAAMGVVSYTKTSRPTDDPAFAKDAAILFQTGSVFVAGKITDHSGAFVQATYNNYDSRNPGNGKWQGKWSADNIDLRYANHATAISPDLLYGISLNNNPSLADPWNTAPAWMQYVPTRFGVTGPDAAPIISQLGAQVGGIAAYAYWNNLLYAEVAGYQSARGAWSLMSPGTSDADLPRLRGAAPYLRLALNHASGAHSLMIGWLALNASLYPDNLHPVGPTTQYRDRGVDAQYQYLSAPHAVTAQMSHIRESIGNGDQSGIAANPHNRLTQWKMKVSYSYQAQYGASLGHISSGGSPDATLYPDPAANPGTRAWVPELFWIPVPNARLGAQFYAYSRFHGSAKNYDGAGRNPQNNNTLFIYLWGSY